MNDYAPQRRRFTEHDLVAALYLTGSPSAAARYLECSRALIYKRAARSRQIRTAMVAAKRAKAQEAILRMIRRIVGEDTT